MTDKKTKQPRPPEVESFDSEATTQEGVAKTTKLYRPTEYACEKFDISYDAPPIFATAIEVRAFLTERRAEIKAEAALEKRRVRLCDELAKLCRAVEVLNGIAPLTEKYSELSEALTTIEQAFLDAQTMLGCDMSSCEPVGPPKGSDND